jgi:hypothetical protein
MTSWGEIKIKSESTMGKGLDYVKLQTGKNRVRLAGVPVSYWYVFNEGHSVVIGDADLDRVREAGHTPKPAVACYVFDRTAGDSAGVVKVLDKGMTVFGPIIDLYKETDIDPCSHEGHEYLITASGSGLSTKYSVIPTKQSPFTPAEQEALKSLDLDALRKRYTPKDGAVNALVGEPEQDIPAPEEKPLKPRLNLPHRIADAPAPETLPESEEDLLNLW